MWLDLQIFGFRGLWSPYFAIYLIILSVLYYLITGPLRKKFGEVEKPTIQQQLSFYSGMLLLYAVKGAPIDLLAHIMLSAHMAQVAIYLLVFPIFIIKGIPEWIWEEVFNLRGLKTILKIFSQPLVALILFNLLFSLYHMPIIFDFSKSSRPLHWTISIIMLFMAFMLWWNILTPLKQYERLQPLLKMLYLLGSAALITPACALIIFADQPLFSAYQADGAWLQAMSLCVPKDVLTGLASTISGPEMFSPLSINDDQQLGGIVMQTLTTVIYGVMIGRVFFTKFAIQPDTVDPLPDHRYIYSEEK